MTADDFEQQPRGPRLFDFWLAKQPLPTLIGNFKVVLYEPPDEELLACANQFVEVVATRTDEILEIIYDHYQQAAAHKHWMRGCVPVGLPRHRVSRYLRSRSITVLRDRKRNVGGTIFISPQWDTEHGITLVTRNGRIVPHLD